MADAATLKRELKTFEAEFRASHGRAPAKVDIPPEVARKYRAYAELKASKPADAKKRRVEYDYESGRSPSKLRSRIAAVSERHRVAEPLSSNPFASPPRKARTTVSSARNWFDGPTGTSPAKRGTWLASRASAAPLRLSDQAPLRIGPLARRPEDEEEVLGDARPFSALFDEPEESSSMQIDEAPATLVDADPMPKPDVRTARKGPQLLWVGDDLSDGDELWISTVSARMQSAQLRETPAPTPDGTAEAPALSKHRVDLSRRKDDLAKRALHEPRERPASGLEDLGESAGDDSDDSDWASDASGWKGIAADELDGLD